MSIFARTVLPALGAMAFAAPAHAEVPRVVTDIAPVHSLVAQVMGDLGTPDLIMPPGASPHSFAMRPSQARALSQADLVVWIGSDLTPWLDRPIDALGGDVRRLGLLEDPATLVLDTRIAAVFGAEDHDDDHGHGHTEAKATDAHDHNHDHAEAKAADAHDHDHDHGLYDPHAWLDPENAKLWLDRIAAVLAEMDPANAATYAANAATARADLDSLIADVTAQLAPVKDRPFLVFHDAYQYFETRFGIASLGAIALSDASAPSAARLSELRAAIQEAGAVCAFAEPQFDARLVAAVTEGIPARSAVLDPLGSEIALGAGHYSATIRALAAAQSACLAAS